VGKGGVVLPVLERFGPTICSNYMYPDLLWQFLTHNLGEKPVEPFPL